MFTGCASVLADNPYKNTMPKNDPETKEVYNFHKMKIVIADWYGVNPPQKKVPATSEKYWHEWMNHTYKLRMEYKPMFGAEGDPLIVANYCVAGDDDLYPEGTKDEDKISYVFMIDERLALEGIKAGLFYDLADIKYYQFNNKDLYEQNVKELFSKGRSVYAYKPKEFYQIPGIYFNKRILQKNGYNPDDLYEWQKSGKWTWAVFEEMCKNLTQDVDWDGDIDIYAMCANSVDFGYLALYSNGAAVIKKNNRGDFYNSSDSDQAMEAWYWMSKMWNKYQLPQKDRPDDYYYKAFKDGEVVFFVGRQSDYNANGVFTKMFDDYGFVAFPKGPSGDGKYRGFYDSSRYAVIPASYSKERVEKIVKALNVYYEPVPGYSNVWKNSYSEYYRDEVSVNDTVRLLTQYTNPLYEKIIPNINSEDMIKKIITGELSPELAFIIYSKGWKYVLEEANRKSLFTLPPVYKDYMDEEVSKKRKGFFARLKEKRDSMPKYSQLTAEEKEMMSERQLRILQKREEREDKKLEKQNIKDLKIQAKNEKKEEKRQGKEAKKQERKLLKEMKKEK